MSKLIMICAFLMPLSSSWAGGEIDFNLPQDEARFDSSEEAQASTLQVLLSSLSELRKGPETESIAVIVETVIKEILRTSKSSQEANAYLQILSQEMDMAKASGDLAYEFQLYKVLGKVLHLDVAQGENSLNRFHGIIIDGLALKAIEIMRGELAQTKINLESGKLANSVIEARLIHLSVLLAWAIINTPNIEKRELRMPDGSDIPQIMLAKRADGSQERVFPARSDRDVSAALGEAIDALMEAPIKLEASNSNVAAAKHFFIKRGGSLLFHARSALHSQKEQTAFAIDLVRKISAQSKMPLERAMQEVRPNLSDRVSEMVKGLRR